MKGMQTCASDFPSFNWRVPTQLPCAHVGMRFQLSNGSIIENYGDVFCMERVRIVFRYNKCMSFCFKGNVLFKVKKHNLFTSAIWLMAQLNACIHIYWSISLYKNSHPIKISPEKLHLTERRDGV